VLAEFQHEIGLRLHTLRCQFTDIANWQLVMVMSTTYSLGITLAKASFAVLYLRLLDKQGRWHVYLNRAILVFLFCQATEELFTVVFQCRPVRKAWEPEVEGSCIPLEPIWYTGFTCNLIMDLILFLQPIPWMWGLRLPLAKRLGLIALLSLGLLWVLMRHAWEERA
jgi:hypothetical protein